MNFLFVHSWQGFSLAEWYLRNAVNDHCTGNIGFHSLDVPGNHIPASDAFPRAFFHLEPDLVGFSCFYWNISSFLEATRWIKRVRSGVKIVLGGPQVRSEKAAARILMENDAVDFVVRGTGEAALVALLEFLSGSGTGKPGKVPGLSYREGPLVCHNKESGSGPERSLIFYNRNPELIKQIALVDEVSYETISGCYEKCAFCYYPTTRYRTLDDELVLAELSFICKQKIRNLRICDTHFGGTKERAKRILKHLARHNRGIIVRIYPDLHHIDEEYITLVKEAGAQITSISLQSTGKDVLKRISRKPIHHLTGQIALVLKHFPEVPADLIIGLPGDSYEGLKNTFREVLDLGFINVNLFRLMLFPGTAMYEERSSYFNEDRLQLSSIGQVITSSDFPAEVQQRLSHLLTAMETASPFSLSRDIRRSAGSSVTHVLDLFDGLDPVILNKLHHELILLRSGKSYGEQGDLVNRLADLFGGSVPRPVIKRDLLRWAAHPAPGGHCPQQE